MLCMVWVKCRTESSFLVFVCFESNAIQRLFSWFLSPKDNFILNFKSMYGLGPMQHREFFSGFCMFGVKCST